AAALVEEVDRLGGSARAIERGDFQEAIGQSAYQLQQSQEAGTLTVVGVNRFTDNSPAPSLARPDFGALAARQRTPPAEVRAGRDQPAVARELDRVGAAAATESPLMPPIIEAVRARATLGEISDVLRRAWGVYRPA